MSWNGTKDAQRLEQEYMYYIVCMYVYVIALIFIVHLSNKIQNIKKILFVFYFLSYIIQIL